MLQLCTNCGAANHGRSRLLGGQGRLKAGCGQNCPPHNLCRIEPRWKTILGLSPRVALAALFLLLCPHAPGQQLAPEALALAQASRLVRETVDALANCVCLESVARSQTDKKGKQKQDKRDTLQIEVTTIGDREWFSWPGQEDAFVEDPRALVSFGLFDTGQLTSDLKTVFLDRFAVTHYHGAVTFQTRPALQFDYSVSSVFTHFRLSSPSGSVTAGMKGSFWIDPQTSELLGLSNEASEIPVDFDIRSARTDVIYAPMYREDRRVVLPQKSTTFVENSTGFTSTNQVEFSHCQPYSSTSSIKFDGGAAPVEPAPAPGRREPAPIPAGLSLPMRFGTPITARSAVGERLSLVMQADARSHGDKIIGKGAQVQARVRWIKTGACPAPCLAVAIELLSVTTTDGASHPVYASLSQAIPESKVKLNITKVAPTQADLAFGAQRVEASTLSMWIPKIPGVGSFFVLTSDLTTTPDVLMTWSTESPHR